MNDLALVPLPIRCERSPGHLHLTASTTFTGDDKWVRQLRAITLLPLSPATSGTITFQNASDLAGEAYRVRVTESRLLVEAGDDYGFARAVATLLQLLDSEVLGNQKPTSGITIPCCEIDDAPRFRWRGGHLDVCRHYMPVDFLYRFIDLLAFHKFNVFHFHLTEDQGWRMEIEGYPKLTEIGGWRARSPLGHISEGRFDEQPIGGFYRKAELRRLVAYAADRGITIVPEIELPGHAQAALAAYPEFGNTGENITVWDKWGVSENVYAPTDRTLGFLKDVLREVLDVFPSPFIHIGGDECPKAQWKVGADAQARIQSEGLRDEDHLQSWFITQIGEFLAANGRRMVGWDEILEGGLPAGATVMSWRGEAGGIAAANAGHEVIMTPGKPTYFDHYQSEDKTQEPIAIGGCNPLESVYAYEPIPAELPTDKAHLVLGSQFQVWTEYIKTPPKVEYMTYPRACALAEVLWSPKSHRDWNSFADRLEHHLRRLDAMHVTYRNQHPYPANLTLR